MTSTGAYTIIDADGLVLGRMASLVAKRLLNGERIIIVNAENAVVSGGRSSVIRQRTRHLEVRGPRWGPYHERRPDGILRRTVRGMLPTEKPRGKEAYKRLRAYIGVPLEFKDRQFETLEEIHSSKLGGRFIRLSDIAKSIGWNP